MITEDYVSFETAKLLKEKGFDGRCIGMYSRSGNLIRTNFKRISASQKREFPIDAPTIQMAMKWLRDEKGIAIIPIIDSILDHEKFLWDIKIAVAKTNETFSQGWVYENPESGYDRAIRYCLENLI